MRTSAPRGLRLWFDRADADDGIAEIRSRFTPGPDEVGWPTVFHRGLHFMVRHEVSYWAALTGTLSVMTGAASHQAERLSRARRGTHRARRHPRAGSRTPVDPRHDGVDGGNGRRFARSLVEPLPPDRGGASRDPVAGVPPGGPPTVSGERGDGPTGSKPFRIRRRSDLRFRPPARAASPWAPEPREQPGPIGAAESGARVPPRSLPSTRHCSPR